jgi:hypothetical protein
MNSAASRRSQNWQGGTLLGLAGFAMLEQATMQQELSMRKIAALGVSLCTQAIGSLDAEAGAWCAYYDSYTYNCGFRTFDQCRATISGESRAWCSPNPAGGYEEPRRPLRRRQ